MEYISSHKIFSPVLILLLTLISSCDEKSGMSNRRGNGNIGEENKYKLTVSGIPDTLSSGNTFDGKIEYESALDTIALSDKTERLTLFYLSSDVSPSVDIKKIKDKEHEIFTSKKPGYIEFKYSVENRGVNYLTGIIEDEVYLSDYKDGKTRIITNNIKISKQIYVQ